MRRHSQPLVVVTGGAGFIGSHLCEALLEQGWRVLALDNLITGCGENLAWAHGKEVFTFLLQDVTQPFEIDGPVEAVCHLASPASPVDFGRYSLVLARL